MIKINRSELEQIVRDSAASVAALPSLDQAILKLKQRHSLARSCRSHFGAGSAGGCIGEQAILAKVAAPCSIVELTKLVDKPSKRRHGCEARRAGAHSLLQLTAVSRVMAQSVAVDVSARGASRNGR